jgi:hypothetical protein
MSEDQLKFKTHMEAQTPEYITAQLISLATEYTVLQQDFNHLAVVCYQTLNELGIMGKDGEMKGDMSNIIGSISKIAGMSMMPGGNVKIQKKFSFMTNLGGLWTRRNIEIMEAVEEFKKQNIK